MEHFDIVATACAANKKKIQTFTVASVTNTVFNAEIPDYFLNSVQWWSPREKDISFVDGGGGGGRGRRRRYAEYGDWL